MQWKSHIQLIIIARVYILSGGTISASLFLLESSEDLVTLRGKLIKV